VTCLADIGKKRKGERKKKEVRWARMTFPSPSSPRPVEMNKIRGVLYNNIIVRNESIFQQMASL
jgi:hypothetical protein